MSPRIEVGDLHKYYRNVQAVKGLSLAVAKGEAVALLGPNGSGKTTTLRCLAGLLRPQHGSIRICGLDLERQPRQARRRVSYLPQQARFPTSLSVREVVEFHARLRGLTGERAEQSLREAGLGEGDEHRVVGELSGGMRQRLSLAVAGLPDVEVMLLDEPTANLDPGAAIQLRKLAQEWRESGRSLLFSTHVLDDVEELADRVVVMVDGECVAEEQVSRLRADLGRDALLRVDVGRPTSRHVAAALEAGAESACPNSHTILIKAPAHNRYPILRGLERLGPVRHFETEAPSIERVYMRYVGDRQKGAAQERAPETGERADG